MQGQVCSNCSKVVGNWAYSVINKVPVLMCRECIRLHREEQDREKECAHRIRLSQSPYDSHARSRVADETRRRRWEGLPGGNVKCCQKCDIRLSTAAYKRHIEHDHTFIHCILCHKICLRLDINYDTGRKIVFYCSGKCSYEASRFCRNCGKNAPDKSFRFCSECRRKYGIYKKEERNLGGQLRSMTKRKDPR